MRNKIASNNKDYATEPQKIAYIQSRLANKADTMTAHRFASVSSTRYSTSEQVFEHLRSLFLNRNKKRESKAEYQRLYQKSSAFPKFYSRFLFLASQAEIPEIMWKEDLVDKISLKLKELTFAEQADETLDYNSFAEICTTRDYQIRQVSSLRSQLVKKSSPQTTAPLSTPPASQPQSPSQYTFEERKAYAMAKAGGSNNCRYCKEEGHWAKNCPKLAIRSQGKRVGLNKVASRPQEEKSTNPYVISAMSSESEIDTPFTVSCLLANKISIPACIDTCACGGNYIDKSLALQLQSEGLAAVQSI